MLANADKWKDKPALSYGREILTHNLEDIASTPAEGRRLIDTYVAPIRKGVGDMTRWMKGWAECIGALDTGLYSTCIWHPFPLIAEYISNSYNSCTYIYLYCQTVVYI